METVPVGTSHVRPRVRRQVHTSKDSIEDIDNLIKDTQHRLEEILSVREKATAIQSTLDIHANSTSLISQKQQKETEEEEEEEEKKSNKKKEKDKTSRCKGILKHPKYSLGRQTKTTPCPERALPNSEECHKPILPTVNTKIPKTIQQFVIERDTSKDASFLKMPTCYDPVAVEGYTPRESKFEYSGNQSKRRQSKPLKSVSSIDNTNECIDIDEKLMNPDDDDDDDDDFDKDIDDDDDDDPVFGTIHHDDDDLWSQNSEEHQEPRSFLVLWKALADWVTPEAVKWFRQFHEATSSSSSSSSSLSSSPKGELETSVSVSAAAAAAANTTILIPNLERTDVEDSRCLGLSAILHMHLSHYHYLPAPSGVNNLHHSENPVVDQLVLIQRRLADFIRLFSFRNPTPRLSTKLWRAMTCILIDMVRRQDTHEISSRNDIPSSAMAVGLTKEEYIYLTKKCFLSFDADSNNLVNDTNESEFG
jgi:hypothetical protein